jgi:hypothetical protein
VLGVYNGATTLISRAHTRTDNLNLTNVWDNVTTANNQSLWYEPSNKLQNANGPWGNQTVFYDGVGNRTQDQLVVGSTTTTDVYGYPATSNKLTSITRPAGGGQGGRATTTRAFTYEA